MSAFDNIAGYSSIKKELIRITDMLNNSEVYKSMGVKLPKGVMVYGEPGLGKTLMATAVLEECELPSFIIRKTKSGSDFIAEFNCTFNNAIECAPSIILLDDLDKFSSGENAWSDELVAVQANIDVLKDKEVYVIATANDIFKLPDSLVRNGRFDIRLEIEPPNDEDAMEIIKHYLSKKALNCDVSIDDIARMIQFSCCADLETILNEAAIRASYRRGSRIEREDLIGAVLASEYNILEINTKAEASKLRAIAIHEAGHLAVSEILEPGSVGMAAVIGDSSSMAGFVRYCKKPSRFSDTVYRALGGIAAEKMYLCSDANESASRKDLQAAIDVLEDSLIHNAANGISTLSTCDYGMNGMSEAYKIAHEAVMRHKIEAVLQVNCHTIDANRKFFEAVVEALIEKRVLLHSDIKRLFVRYDCF